ncbi:MAG: hypothetical protein A4E45_01277 [Methanosaeta sp. PtaB.Bin039]|nr:MAG: hypothetical protein A4E45_01277 [Methanosaeta sp. PtaB.Bin039]OPY44564.1 MAG: hypothetical protein A4E47_01416 [Methanosaeta sp. PtaU1.Bin028]
MDRWTPVPGAQGTLAENEPGTDAEMNSEEVNAGIAICRRPMEPRAGRLDISGDTGPDPLFALQPHMFFESFESWSISQLVIKPVRKQTSMVEKMVSLEFTLKATSPLLNIR